MPRVIPDIRASGRTPPLIGSLPVAAAIGMPVVLLDGGRPAGLWVVDTAPREWSEAEIDGVRQFAAALEDEATSLAELAWYRNLVEGLDAVVWEMDARAWTFSYVSRSAESVLGYPASLWLSEPGFWQERIVHPLDRDWALEFCMRATEEGRDHEFEYRAVTADGRVIWLQDRVRVETDEEGRPRRLRGIMVDVTEAKKSTRALQESEERFRMLAENIEEIFWIFEVGFSRAVYVSPAYERVWGRPSQAVYEHPLSFLADVHPDDMVRVREAIERLATGAIEPIEYRVRHVDGSIRWVRSRGFPVFDPDGRVFRLVGTTEDITDRKMAEEALQRSEDRFRSMIEHAVDVILVVAEDGSVKYRSPSYQRIFEYESGEEVFAELDLLHPDDRHLARELLADARAVPGGVAVTELRMRDASGGWRLLDVTCKNLLDQPAVGGLVVNAHDITEARAREERMRLFATALENLDEAVAIASFEGKLIYANATHARLLGYDISADPLPNFRDFAASGEAVETAHEAMKVAAEQGTWSGRLDQRSADGRIIPLWSILGRVDRRGGESLLFMIARDITEDLKTEQHLRRAERLASVGTLIGGVAHELNNPLHAIHNFAELMLLETRGNDDREALEIILRESERAARVVSDLRLVARQTQQSERQPADLTEIVGHILKLRRYSLDTGNIEVDVMLDRALPLVLADRGQMEQVILNLVVNAEQAMERVEGTRRLSVRTRRAGDEVEVEIGDTGLGIAPQHLDRIFDPFFTTKAQGEGTGLGLSLAYSIVSEHGGTIHVESEAGSGTVFRVRLPASAAVPPQTLPSSADRKATPDSLRILAVDDEPAILAALSRFLTRRGHLVETAADGNAALRKIEDAGNVDGYDVIVSDFRMPGLGGDQLFTRLRDQGRGLERRLIFLTGDAANSSTARRLADADVPVLYKPIPLDEAAEVIERRAKDAGR